MNLQGEDTRDPVPGGGLGGALAVGIELETCWPEVEVVKTLEAKYRTKGIDFVHIETYKGGRPDANHTNSPWFDEWKLQSDPWVFVVNHAGMVAAKFEGPTAPDEIDPSLSPLGGS